MEQNSPTAQPYAPQKPEEVAISLNGLSFSYGERRALDDLSLEIRAGEMFGILGPNGSGKSTLFRLLSTLFPLNSGSISVFGRDLKTEARAVRGQMGLVFQQPSLDDKLTVSENLWAHGRLYGMGGPALKMEIEKNAEELGVSDRPKERVETLSGGLKRRVELAKSLLHRPQLLIMDEPSTGLDPHAHEIFWGHVKRLHQEVGLTIIVTTHIMEEADSCDRLAILNEGKVVALESPATLRSEVGDLRVVFSCADPAPIAATLNEDYNLSDSKTEQSRVIVYDPAALQHIETIHQKFADNISEISIGKPSLRDVFFVRTGRDFNAPAPATTDKEIAA